MNHQPQALKPKNFEGLKKYHLIETTIKKNEPVGLKRELSRPPGNGEVFFPLRNVWATIVVYVVCST